MNEMSGDSTVVRRLSEYVQRVADAPDPGVAFQMADEAARDLIGHRLFTIMQFNPDTMEVKRCYSSNPEEYPPGGRKAKRDTQWGRHVLEQGQVFVGYNADDIRANFDDHAVIERLGLASVLNMPIRSLGRTVGTMNLLDEAGYYGKDHVAIASIIAGALADVMLYLNLRDRH
ncbi:MAG: GAF domain-containing protein [Rhodospirillales bacterium]